jgi:hypothetical protein
MKTGSNKKIKEEESPEGGKSEYERIPEGQTEC